jgi:hypothetical protein
MIDAVVSDHNRNGYSIGFRVHQARDGPGACLSLMRLPLASDGDFGMFFGGLIIIDSSDQRSQAIRSTVHEQQAFSRQLPFIPLLALISG